MAFSRIVYAGRLFPELYSLFLKKVEESKEEDLLAPVAVLVSSNVAAQFLKRRLAEELGGYVNIDFLTFFDLAGFFHDYGSIGYHRTLPSIGEYLIVKDILENAEIPEPFSEVRKTEGLTASFLGSFADLGEGGVDAAGAADFLLKRGSEFEARVRGVFELYRRFRDRIKPIGLDSISLFSEAIERAGSIETKYAFFGFGLYDFNELQWRLISEVSKHHPFTFFVPYGDGEEYAFARPTLERFAGMGFDIMEGPKSGRLVTASRVRIVNAPGEEEESRAIVERIIALVRERGYAFSDVAVLLPTADPYQDLVCEALGEAKIPFFAQANPLSVESSVAKGILNLLPLLRGGFKRGELIDFLSASPLRREGAVPRAVDAVALWIKASAEEGISAVGDEWEKESMELVEKLSRRSTGGDDRFFDAARFVHGVISRILGERKRFLTPSSWTDFTERLISLAVELFGNEDDPTYEHLNAIPTLDAVASPVLFETFASVVGKVLSAPAPPTARFGEGVSVLPMISVRGLRFKAVFIPGLVERVFPSIVRQDPLLLDEDRRKINEFFEGKVLLTEKMERLDEEKLIFAMAMNAAEDFLQMSYPRYEDGTGRPRMMSSYFRFVVQDDGSAGRGAARYPARIDEERIGRFIGVGVEGSRRPISPQELFLSGAGRFLGGDGILPVGSFFKAASKMVRERWGKKRFTRYDGVLQGKKAQRELKRLMVDGGWAFSPTSFEQYARCPFAYFLSRVLGVETIDEVDMISVTPAMRGIITHRILARLYEKLGSKGLFPLYSADREVVMNVVDEVVLSELGKAEESEPVGLDVFWELERERIREAVYFFVDAELEEDSPFVPSYFERSFGVGAGEDVSFELKSRKIHFRGRIDRLDVSRDASEFRVIDYKTGKLNGKYDGIEGGRHIQLPIYLIAASSILNIPIEKGVAEYRSVNMMSPGKVVRFEGAEWGEVASELVEVIETFVEGMTKGLFFALADEKLCQNCALRSACPAGHTGATYRKAEADERAERYLAVTGAAEK